jgi:nucleotide-binding universal stress UspA family protein
MDFTAFLAIVLTVNLLCAVVASYVAVRWGRDPFSWVIVCAVLGPFGLIALIALRPGATTPVPPTVAGTSPDQPKPRILVPVDGSVIATDAVRYVVSAFGTSANLTIMTVLPRERGEVPSGADSPRRQEGSEESRSHLAAAESVLRSAGIPFQEVTAFGEPAEEIMRAAREGNFDLIVMGRRGRGGLAKALLGSVSERVVRDSGCAVTVVG